MLDVGGLASIFVDPNTDVDVAPPVVAVAADNVAAVDAAATPTASDVGVDDSVVATVDVAASANADSDADDYAALAAADGDDDAHDVSADDAVDACCRCLMLVLLLLQ